MLRAVTTLTAMAIATQQGPPCASAAPSCSAFEGDTAEAEEAEGEEAEAMELSLLQRAPGRLVQAAMAEEEEKLVPEEGDNTTLEKADVANTTWEKNDVDVSNTTSSTVTLCKVVGCRSYQPGRSCQCTSLCSQYGNCCDDYRAVCEGSVPTCKGKGCGAYKAGQSCQCTTSCSRYGNCCHDYTEACVSAPATPGGGAAEGEAYESSGQGMNFLMFNPHGECFESYASQCTSAFREFTDIVLNNAEPGLPALDFAALAYTSGKYTAPSTWASFTSVCRGWHTDDIMLLYDTAKWMPVVNASSDDCMEKIGNNLARPYYVQAFTARLPAATTTTTPTTTIATTTTTERPTTTPTGLPTTTPTGRRTTTPTGRPTTTPTMHGTEERVPEAVEAAGNASSLLSVEQGDGNFTEQGDGNLTVQGDGNFTVVVVAAHFPHGFFHAYGLENLKKAIKDVMEASGSEKVVVIADTNMGNSQGGRDAHRRRIAVAGPTIMNFLLGDPEEEETVQATRIAFTCCGRDLNIDGYDRIMANFGTHMETVLPFTKTPYWAQRNFHLPVIGKLDY